MPDPAKPKITYFDIRGRGEPIRLMLEELEIAYDDVQITGAEWPSLKETTPFGGLPSYREGEGENDLELYQSHAIYRHLARVHDLYGNTEEERVRCDIVCEAFRDAKDHLGGAAWRPDFEPAAFARDEIPPQLAALEKLQGGRREHWVGEDLTLADVLAFAYADDVELLYPGSLTPGLAAFRESFQVRPRVRAYVESDRRPPALMYGPNGKIYPANPS